MLLTIDKLQSEIDLQAQNYVRNEIEIIGVPEVRDESLMHIVLTASKKISIDLNTQDVDWIAHAGSAKKIISDSTANFPRPIVSRLLRRTKQDEIIKIRSKKCGLTYCWTKNGTIYVRKQDGNPAQFIRNQEDLLRVFPIDTKPASNP
ncbi:hypothetical protein ACJJTC_006361 [Scirpophaga incertulas]